MDDELQLPDVIIQHIQSFLDRRQAARSIVLSKSWHSAYSTRPILDFDERDFQIKKVFSEFVKRNMQRYHELNLKVEDFRLRIKVLGSNSVSLANEFVARALKLGVSDFSLEITDGNWKYVLPVQVFEAKSLLKLSVVGCQINQQFDGDMICSNLLSLTLCRVFIESDMIRDIMLRCRLLETLYLSECRGLFKVNLSKLHNLKEFSVTKCTHNSLKFPLIEFEGRIVGPSICNRVNVPEYGKLSCLILERVKIDDFFFHDFPLKFPCLEDLSLRLCDGWNNIEISSRSLKYISLMDGYELKKAKFEVPSICTFKFSAANIPSLSFMTSSREYESYISFTFTYWGDVRDCWFLDLKKFLTELSRSRTSLSITSFLDKRKYRVANNRGYPIPVVDNLMIKIYPSSRLWSAVSDDVFWSCRPKFITFCDDHDDDDDDSFFKTRKILRKFLVQQASQDCSEFPYMNDLEEVNVEFFEETLKEWRPMHWQAFLGSSKVKKNEQFRFGLKWRAC